MDESELQDETVDWVAKSGVVDTYDPLAPQPFEVIGTDERKQVSKPRNPPFRWVSQLIGYSSSSGLGRRKAGTAFVIGQRTLVTAAHNLWIGGSRGAMFDVYPGLNGDRRSPDLGSYRVAQAVAHPTYTSSRDSRYDVAVLALESSLSPDLIVPSYGALPWSQVDPQSLHGGRGMVTGYPLRTPGNRSGPVNSLQYYSVAPIGFTRGKFYYLADTTEGQSGSPLLVAMPDRNGNLRSTAVGIHVQGGNQYSGNSAVVIGESVAEFIGQHVGRFEAA